MRQISKLVGAGAIVILSTAMAVAAPCSTGSTAGKDGQMAASDKSSKVEPNAGGNVSPGAKTESPGTVGAMNNVGANRATSADDVAKQQDGKPTASDAAKGC